MRGCLGWLRNSSDCHLVIPEPGDLSPLIQISAPELESGKGVMSSGWAWRPFGYPDGCPEAHLCIPVTYLRHTLGDSPPLPPYTTISHTSCDPGSTCGLPRVHYGDIRTTQPYFTKADMHGIPMAHPENTHGIPAAHPEYALDTRISHLSLHPWHTRLAH